MSKARSLTRLVLLSASKAMLLAEARAVCSCCPGPGPWKSTLSPAVPETFFPGTTVTCLKTCAQTLAATTGVLATPVGPNFVTTTVSAAVDAQSMWLPSRDGP